MAAEFLLDLCLRQSEAIDFDFYSSSYLKTEWRLGANQLWVVMLCSCRRRALVLCESPSVLDRLRGGSGIKGRI